MNNKHNYNYSGSDILWLWYVQMASILASNSGSCHQSAAAAAAAAANHRAAVELYASLFQIGILGELAAADFLTEGGEGVNKAAAAAAAEASAEGGGGWGRSKWC